MTLLLTLHLSAVCCGRKARLTFLAFVFFHCPCLRHRLLALLKLQSAVLKAPRKRLEGGRGWGGGDRAKPHPKLFSSPVQSLPRLRKLHSSAGPPSLCPGSAGPPPARSPRIGGVLPRLRLSPPGVPVPLLPGGPNR